jgi:hypothetical protein
VSSVVKTRRAAGTLLLQLLLMATFAQAGPVAKVSLTKEQVWSAVLEAAASRGIRLPDTLKAEDVQWAAPALRIADGSRLTVQLVGTDKLLGQLRFRLRLAESPSAPWISVWCPAGDQAGARVDGIGLGSALQNRRPAPVVELVSMRRAATLRLHSQNASAMLWVKVLQPGRLGEVVRVRVLGNGHTLLARVAGRDVVQAEF